MEVEKREKKSKNFGETRKKGLINAHKRGEKRRRKIVEGRRHASAKQNKRL